MNSPITDERLKEILGIFETIGSKPGFSAESELASMASELLAAREALRPIQETAAELSDAFPDDAQIINIGGKRPVTAGEIRKIRALSGKRSAK